jgi:hypothetical protein
MSPYITPPSKVWHHNTRRSPGGCQICSSKGDWVKEGRIDVARCAGVFAVELRYLRLCVQLCMLLPLVVTIVIAHPAGHRPGMGSGCMIDNLTMGNTGWRQWKWGGRARQYAPWLTHALMTKGPRCRWDNLDNDLLVVISLPSNQTLSPGLKTGAGLCQWL